jgi:hypothetical protein
MKTIQADKVPYFNGVLEFARWYANCGMPLLPTANTEVFLSDDAAASCLFRHGRYQVEIYLIFPNAAVPLHEHPGVDNIELSRVAWSNSLSDLTLKSALQRSGFPHGGDFKSRASDVGFPLISAQKWEDGLEISTIGARWKGNTAGPKHEALIRRFNPGCLVYPGYADVTKRVQSVKIL